MNLYEKNPIPSLKYVESFKMKLNFLCCEEYRCRTYRTLLNGYLQKIINSLQLKGCCRKMQNPGKGDLLQGH